MLWAALLTAGAEGAAPSADALQAVATWALQFTPRVALCDGAVLMEVHASLRLFGGRPALRERLLQEGAELGVHALAWAGNSLAARWLVRCGLEDGLAQPLDALLDPLPLGVLTELAAHHHTLARLGCTTLGDLRRLPRGGLVQRFGTPVLNALDIGYGLRPQAHDWVVLPESFAARLALPARVEMAPALLWGARRLLVQLCGWLAARHGGTTAFTLRWIHDGMRARHTSDSGALTLRTAAPSRDVDHLCRLLAEHLAHVRLHAPVGELQLVADEVVPLAENPRSLLRGACRAWGAEGEFGPSGPGFLPNSPAHGQAVGQDDDALLRVLERMAARLGPQRVLRPVATDDHRMEWMQLWAPWPEPPPRKNAAPPRLPQPTWALAEPLKLAMRGPRPMYQGVLQLLTGPHRVEAGWWHRPDSGPSTAPRTGQVQRDYWVALSEHAGVLWIYQERLADEQTAWYLHGVFA